MAVAPPSTAAYSEKGVETSKTAHPVDVALPSGIRYPAGVGSEELSILPGLLQREC